MKTYVIITPSVYKSIVSQKKFFTKIQEKMCDYYLAPLLPPICALLFKSFLIKSLYSISSSNCTFITSPSNRQQKQQNNMHRSDSDKRLATGHRPTAAIESSVSNFCSVAVFSSSACVRYVEPIQYRIM